MRDREKNEPAGNQKLWADGNLFGDCRQEYEKGGEKRDPGRWGRDKKTRQKKKRVGNLINKYGVFARAAGSKSKIRQLETKNSQEREEKFSKKSRSGEDVAKSKSTAAKGRRGAWQKFGMFGGPVNQD